MQADVFSVPMTDGAEIVIRHYSRPGALRLYITHGNGFAVDGYRIFWEPLLDTYDVVLFDMRNHGRNARTSADGHNYGQFARDVTSIHQGTVARIGPAKSVGIFHSMSARSAMKNAVQFGSPFDALVLFDPPSVPPRNHRLYEAMREFEIKLIAWAADRPDRFASVDELEAQYSEARASARWHPQARRDMAEAVLRPLTGGIFELSCRRELEAAIYLGALTLDLWPMASELGLPTLLVGADPSGTKGPPTGPANHALGHEGGYTYHGVDGAGHLLQIEKPEICREILIDFLARL
ncbi:alpha/beta fold hydrolase [Agrobacterium tumefaciens]|uniref:Alpha/beta hydrolase n=1 Tax=Agrobacterium tumefaciens TaxID=358 RepID=A0AA44J9P9_AGRTU|nr:alpha/beta hydrolase [Agrobacterium tumefaciens]NSL21250.1 alpha/beta hydrolase [Agrobacterium tumefaciens]NTB83822.1 alpha/beta hydrolase [Agrobacterium tumefaciens]NTC20709.1 alpha/beta hydrolase [Agrobacterium tumefaciens]NTC29293.1 alpha/beta hydrolase [Agrobacterium tumefaciens]NTC57789.1 alpha/beta hydrolase [Agrobacterium tumefaciens]